MKRLRYLIIAALLTPLGAHAAKYAGEAFSLGAGGRGLALGGAVVAGPFDAASPYWNPAGMNRLDTRGIIAMHAETFGSLLNHDFVGYVDARPRAHATIRSFGFYGYYLGGGGIRITQLNEFDRPYVVNEENHADILLGAALAGRIRDRIDFGLTAKIIYRDIGTESGYGLTLDAGALYDPFEWATVGLMVTDLTTGFIRYSGKTFDSGANTETIYPTVKPGLALRKSWREFTGTLLMSGDVKFESLKRAAQYWSGPLSVDTHFGGEFAWRRMLFGRVGSDIGRLTAGGGIDVRDITVDFAWLHQSDFDETFRVSAGYRF